MAIEKFNKLCISSIRGGLGSLEDTRPIYENFGWKLDSTGPGPTIDGIMLYFVRDTEMKNYFKINELQKKYETLYYKFTLKGYIVKKEKVKHSGFGCIWMLYSILMLCMIIFSLIGILFQSTHMELIYAITVGLISLKVVRKFLVLKKGKAMYEELEDIIIQAKKLA